MSLLSTSAEFQNMMQPVIARDTHNSCRAEEYYALAGKQIDNDTERQPNVCQCEPGKDQQENVVLLMLYKRDK